MGDDCVIKIYTLGEFDIEINGESVLGSIGNQPKLMKLFKYFLTFQGRKLLPENIIEDIWRDDDYKNPLNVLRTQISRVRNMIDFKKHNVETFFDINYIDGYYVFKLHENCVVDFLVMQKCIESYHTKTDEPDAIQTCKVGVDLYRGEYLGELGLEDWIIPIRNRFDRLYVSNLAHYLSSLREMSMDNLIISICEDAMAHKPYEEIIHIYFIESLLNLGQTRCALNHYNFFTVKLYGDLGVSPSNQLKALYQKIKTHEEDSTTILNLNNLDEELRDSDSLEGALVCDKNYFKLLYNLELRFNERNRRDAFLGIISISKLGFRELSKKDLNNAISILADVSYHGLRKGDVITTWNDSQILLLLYDLKEDHLEEIIKRIRSRFNLMIKDEKISINIKFKSL